MIDEEDGEAGAEEVVEVEEVVVVVEVVEVEYDVEHEGEQAGSVGKVRMMAELGLIPCGNEVRTFISFLFANLLIRVLQASPEVLNAFMAPKSSLRQLMTLLGFFYEGCKHTFTARATGTEILDWICRISRFLLEWQESYAAHEAAENQTTPYNGPWFYIAEKIPGRRRFYMAGCTLDLTGRTLSDAIRGTNDRVVIGKSYLFLL